MEFNQQQIEAINHYKGCCNVIASAGSGKTSVLVKRIENLVGVYKVNPENILAITFSKKAKENIKERLKPLLPFSCNAINIETFHSFGYKILKMFNKESFELFSADWQKVNIFEKLFQSTLNDNDPDGGEIADAISKVSFMKNTMQKPRNNDIGKLFEDYDDYKKQNNILDFDDMLSGCYDILKNNKEALQYCQDKFQFMLVDEMQDTNTLQYEIIKMVAKKNKNLFVVGDMLQAIYEWRGSDNSYIINMDKAWKDVSVINLNTNYRSSKNIVDFSNQFARFIPETRNEIYRESVSNKNPHSNPLYSVYADETDEVKHIAEIISKLVVSGRYSYKDIAILSRTNAQLQNAETGFYNKIPCENTDGVSFVDKSEIKLVLSYLRLAYDIDDDKSFEYLYCKPNRWLGKQFLDEVKGLSARNKISLFCAMFKIDRRNWRFKSGIDEICTVINKLQDMQKVNYSAKEQIEFVRKKLRIDSFVCKDVSSDQIDSDKIDNLNNLELLAENKNTADFLSVIDNIGQSSRHKQSNSVKLMTIHRSKGLEFPVVFVIGVNDKVFPHYRNDNLSEEKRLMYVAITRAESELYLSSTKRYQGKQSRESMFVQRLGFKQKV